MSMLDFAKNLLFDLKYAHDESMGQQEELRMGEVSRDLVCPPRPLHMVLIHLQLGASGR